MQGLTLVELLVAIAILAILLAFSVPTFQTIVLNAQIRTASESMLAGLNLARTEALRRNTRVSLWIVNNTTASCSRTNTGNSWVVSVNNPAGACNAAASETSSPRLVQARAGTEGSANVNVTASAGAAASSCITFNGLGSVEATCTGGGSPITRIRFDSANADVPARSLEIRVTGSAVRLCDPAPAANGGTSQC